MKLTEHIAENWRKETISAAKNNKAYLFLSKNKTVTVHCQSESPHVPDITSPPTGFQHFLPPNRLQFGPVPQRYATGGALDGSP